ncbi:MAG: AAC(3) family N-acetyltransferase [Firmicutes bacterium]|nr:AAC(3) family N-acetyltransferase [Bacillota bacterium]
MNDAKKLLADMKALGIKEGETILVHASMKALGTKETPEAVLDTLQKALGENGTLLLPALTYENVTPEHPVFDADKTVPCIGLLPRTFWKIPGVVRSVHPTHSVCARGKRAVELTALHGEDITPVGKNSPFMKLPEIGGRLLFIGEVLDCCTFMHGVEERFGTDYVLTKEKIRYVVNGEEKYMYGHDFKGWETTYRRVKEILDPAKNEIVTGKIGDATCYLIDAKALLKRAEEKLQENQHWFVVPRE